MPPTSKWINTGLRIHDTEKKFLDKVKEVNGCWEWQAAFRESGYGIFRFRSGNWQAHRVSYTLCKGEIPEGLVICHACDNKKCVNPEHLFLGTLQDNTRDAVSKGKHAGMGKTHCPRGHEYTPGNTYKYKGKNGRVCRTCSYAASAASRKAKQLLNQTPK